MKRLGATLAMALTPLGFAFGCVDGVTPDCSDAATQCGPSLDATAERTEAALPEAAALDSAADDAADAADAADLDAGDEG
jgi:hypothetical protein